MLDNDGLPPHNIEPKEYLKYFNLYDIHQCWIGSFFHIGALMGLMKNEDLLEYIIPPDNMEKINIDVGVFHFRFWNLGHWYDVVIDDFLPINKHGELIFSYNKLHPNEYWVPLFEKALAKY